MSRTAEIKSQFIQLNDHIAEAISSKDFSRAMMLDKARQEILRDLCLLDPSSIDKAFFDFIEDCAKNNASLIQSVETEMKDLTFRQSRNRKVHSAYAGR